VAGGVGTLPMMSDTVILVVLLAAVLHASWNALVKGGRDRTLNLAAVVIGHVPFALAVLPFVPLPAADSWPWLLCGIALHTGYQGFLLLAYRQGDLSRVYPIARGSAPLIVTGVSVGALGVVLQTQELLGIAVIATGILSVCLVRQRGTGFEWPSAGFALVTGVFIAGYSLVDGHGARLAGTAVGFYAWEGLGNAAIVLALSWRLRPTLARELLGPARTVLLVGGGASFAAYALVMWAFTQAPIALVTALRESSIVFAVLIGAWHLKEGLGAAKLLAIALTIAGIALLRFA